MPFKTLLCSMCLAIALLAATPAASAGEAAADAVLVAQLEGESACPSVLHSTEVVEGVFQAIKCGDLCRLHVKLADGSEPDYLASGDIQEFEASSGVRVRVTVEKRQELLGVSGEPERCAVVVVATEIAQIR